MKKQIPNIKEMTLREKINQPIVIQIEKGKTVDFAPGAAFFFGLSITRLNVR